MYDKGFLYDYLVNFYEFSGRAINSLLDMYDYLMYGNDKDFPNDLPKKLQDFLADFWSQKRLIIYKDICEKLPEDRISYYFKNFNVQQLSVIFFALGYGISEDEIHLLMKKGMTTSNLELILRALIEREWKDIQQLEKEIAKNFRTRFSEEQFSIFIKEYAQRKDVLSASIL